MSASGREVAYRLFAVEYDEATHSYSESDEERAPNYVVTPTGARVNRLFLVGVLTEVERVGEEILRARVADPTGAFVVYAGQYQPDEMAFLERAEPPLFVAITGKARTFSPDDSDRIYTSVRPESINEVDAETRDRWTVQAAEHTLARVATFRAALDLGLAGDALRAALTESGVPTGLAAGIPVALEQYGTTEHYLAGMADVAVDALALVAGEADEVSGPDVTPGDTGPGTVDAAALAAGSDRAVVDLVAPSEAVEASAGANATSASNETAAADPSADADATSETGDQTVEEPATAETGASQSETATTDATATTAGADAEPAGAGAAATGGEDPGEFDDGGEGPGEFDAGGEDPGEFDAGDAADDVGEFEPSGEADVEPAERDEGADGTADDGPAADTDADQAAEDVLDEEERERIEEEYGTDFSTGTEVDEPGEAGIEPEAGPIEPPEGTDETAGEPTAANTSDPEATSNAEASDTSDSEVDSEFGTDDTSDSEATPDPETEVQADDEPADEGSEVAAEAPGDEPEPGGADGSADLDLDEAVMDAMADLDDGDGADRERLVATVVDEHGVDPGDVEDAIQDALMAGKCYEPDDAHVKPI